MKLDKGGVARTVAESVVDHVAPEQFTLRTVLSFAPVHHGEPNGVPFSGPTRREWHGKSAGRRGQTPKGRSVLGASVNAQTTAYAPLFH